MQPESENPRPPGRGVVKRAKRIFDPIHHFIELDAGEVALLETPAMQRMRRLRQLGLAYLAYPSAEHSRFSHALGALATGTRVLDALRVHSPEAFDSDAEFAALRRLLRASLLLHDIGHGPFSHASEAVLGIRHEARTAEILALPQVRGGLDALDVDRDEVLALITGTSRKNAAMLSAKTTDNVTVVFPTIEAEPHPALPWVDVRIESAFVWGIKGVPVGRSGGWEQPAENVAVRPPAQLVDLVGGADSFG